MIDVRAACLVAATRAVSKCYHNHNEDWACRGCTADEFTKLFAPLVEALENVAKRHHASLRGFVHLQHHNHMFDDCPEDSCTQACAALAEVEKAGREVPPES